MKILRRWGPPRSPRTPGLHMKGFLNEAPPSVQEESLRADPGRTFVPPDPLPHRCWASAASRTVRVHGLGVCPFGGRCGRKRP